MPTFLRRLRARLKYWNHERDLARELDVHRTMTDQHHAEGAENAAEARRTTALLLGNTTLAREDARAVWVPRFFQQGIQDARYAVRGFRKQWAFTLAAVTMLAIGLGVAAGAFTLVNGVFFRGWPVPESENVFVVGATFPPSVGRVDDGLSYGAYKHFVADGEAADYAAWKIGAVNFTPGRDDRGRHIRPTVFYVSDTFFDALRIPLLMGTPPRPAAEDHEATAVISYRMWQNDFGGDPQILGRTGWGFGDAFTIVGVTAEQFDGLGTSIDVFVPMWTAIRLNKNSNVYQAIVNETACCVSVAGRLRPGSSADQAKQELNGLAAQYRDSVQQPRLKIDVADTTVGGLLLARGSLASMFVLATAAVLFLLVLTCANVGNLFLARNLRRQQEIITRLALGASRSRLIRQLLTEGLVLSAVAGALAWMAAMAVPAIVGASSPQAVPSMFVVDWRVSLLTSAGVVLVCLLVSLAPALRTTRVAWRGGAAMATARTGGLRGALLAIQIAMATVLILSAAMLVRGIQFGLSAPSDFAFQTTMAATVSLREGSTTEQQRSLTAALISGANASATPIGLAERIPVSRHASTETSVREANANVDYSVSHFAMSAAAAGVLKLPLTAGRWASDDPTRGEAVVNETLARQIWGDESPIGRTLTLDYNNKNYSISGVTRDPHVVSLGPIRPTIHTPLDGRNMPVLLVPKTAESIDAVRRLAASVDQGASVSWLSLPDAAAGTVGDSLTGAAIASMVGTAALVMAMIGVFGVFSYLVEERCREIGIRLALGAGRWQIRRAIFGATRAALTAGTLGGFLLAFITAQVLRRFLFGMSTIDPISYAAVGMLLVVTALLATYVPVRRALRANPATTLRAD